MTSDTASDFKGHPVQRQKSHEDGKSVFRDGAAARFGGLLSIAECKFAAGEISREDFIGKMVVVADDAQDADEDDIITNEEFGSLQDELRTVMEKFGISYEESGLAV